MKETDLMIGDWVYNKHHGKNIRFTHYDFFTHTHNDFGEQELAPFAKPTTGRDLEPIPLTPEIILNVIMYMSFNTHCVYVKLKRRLNYEVGKCSDNQRRVGKADTQL